MLQERRAALEIDAQRTARVKSDRRVETLEGKLDAAYAKARSELEQHLQASMGLKSEVERLGRELAGTVAAHSEALAEARRLADLVTEERLAAERAKGESAAARAAVIHFDALVQRARPRQKVAIATPRRSQRSDP